MSFSSATSRIQLATSREGGDAPLLSRRCSMYFCGACGAACEPGGGNAQAARARTFQTTAAIVSRSSMSTGAPSCAVRANLAWSASAFASSCAASEGGGPTASSRAASDAGEEGGAEAAADPASTAAAAAPLSRGAQDESSDAAEPPSDMARPTGAAARSSRRRAAGRPPDPTLADAPRLLADPLRPPAALRSPPDDAERSKTLRAGREGGVRDIL
ncbi:MAG: hypothetical protein GY772_21535 [bacterium]|nr:hypothetical protein [bacterium]